MVNARTVVTPILLDDDNTTTAESAKTPHGACQVITIASSDPSPGPNTTNEAVSTNDPLKTNKEQNALFIEDDSNQTRASATLNSTPRSVVTDPDDVELETANVLLQLGSLSDSGSKHQEELEAAYDNSRLLPVDAAPLEDFTHELARNDTDTTSDQNNNTKRGDEERVESTDSDKTVDYTPRVSPEREITSPKGSLNYKQYGIKRPSPKTGPNRNRRCPYCEIICHSKREWNTHHKAEHTKVQCPDCHKLVPTPDALTRHRYVHNEAHRFKCEICDKICAFQSDLDQHMSKHNEDK